MHPLYIYKQVPSEYTLINYDERHQLFYQKVYLTEHEAHSLNQAFAMNGNSKRYIKNTSRFNKQKI
jgi:hypothetical protein